MIDFDALVAELRSTIEGHLRLCEQATPEPWHAYLGVHGDPVVTLNPEQPAFSAVAHLSTAPEDYGRGNMLLIVAAVNGHAARCRAALEDLDAAVQQAQRHTCLESTDSAGNAGSYVPHCSHAPRSFVAWPCPDRVAVEKYVTRAHATWVTMSTWNATGCEGRESTNEDHGPLCQCRFSRGST